MAIKKTIREYNAVFDPAVEGGFNVSFPSFPGCVTFGRTFEEAQDMAREVLELWIEELISQGHNIPKAEGRSIVYSVAANVPNRAYAPAHR